MLLSIFPDPKSIFLIVSVTPPTTTTRLGGVTTLQDNNKIKTIENIGINPKDQSKRKQLSTFNLNQ
jgi:hypothetical protein